MRGTAWLRPIVAALAMGAIALAGCGGGSSGNGARSDSGSPAAGRGGELTWGKPTDAVAMDPTTASDAPSWEILSLVYDTLVGIDDHLKPTPGLAESWTQPSQTTYVFNIRRGVRFSNGREMTVDDVVGSLRRLIDPKTAAFWAIQLSEVRSVTRAGAWKVKITLAKPRPSFPAALANVAAAVLPMRELRSGTFDPKKTMLGTGPFKVVAHSPGESWRLARNTQYWRTGEPKVDQLIVRIMPEDAARVAALRDGSIDVATFDTPDAVRLLQGQPNIKTVVQQTTDYYTLRVNAIGSAFKDDRLREALSLSIDREQLVKLALGGLGQPSAAAAPTFQNSCRAADVPFAKPDLARARQLVQQAGATGKKVSILATPALKSFSPIAQVLQRNLQEAGLKVDIEQPELAEAIKRHGAGDFDLFIGYNAGYGDPAMVLGFFSPSAAGYGKTWLRPDKTLTQVVEQASESEGPSRQPVLQKACDRIAERANVLPLVTRASIVAYRSDQVSPDIQPVEGYGVPLRHIAEFAAT